MAQWPTVEPINQHVLDSFDIAESVITNIRNVRKQNNIANKVKIELFIKNNNAVDSSFDAVILKMGNLSQLTYTDEKIPNSNSFLLNANEYFIPFGDTIDMQAEKNKLMDELHYTKGFLMSVQKKLHNEKFMAGAPEQVVLVERKKEADALTKISILEEKIAAIH